MKFLAAHAQARNVINWQCGNAKVTLEVNKSTTPYSYDVIFEELKGGKTALVVAPGKFVWVFETQKATLNGRFCRKIP